VEINVEPISGFMEFIHIFNGAACLYSFVFFIMLACFSATMHYQVLDNVTTNESLRKKWNAQNVEERNKSMRVSACDKFRHIYIDELPVSRIQRYHELR